MNFQRSLEKVQTLCLSVSLQPFTLENYKMTDREREFWVLFLYEEEVGAEVVVCFRFGFIRGWCGYCFFFYRFGNVRPKRKVSNYGFVCCVVIMSFTDSNGRHRICHAFSWVVVFFLIQWVVVFILKLLYNCIFLSLV